MKRVVVFVLSVMLLVGVAGCGYSNGSGSGGTSSSAKPGY